MQPNLSLWQKIRYRLGIYTGKELDELAIVALDVGRRQGEKDGYNKALEALPKVLADVAEEKLNKLFEKNEKTVS